MISNNPAPNTYNPENAQSVIPTGLSSNNWQQWYVQPTHGLPGIFLGPNGQVATTTYPTWIHTTPGIFPVTSASPFQTAAITSNQSIPNMPSRMVRPLGPDNTLPSVATSSSSQQAIDHVHAHGASSMNPQQQPIPATEHESLRTEPPVQAASQFLNTSSPPYFFIPPPGTMIQKGTVIPYPYAPMTSSVFNPNYATYQEQINALSRQTNQCAEVYTQQNDGLLGAAPSTDIDDRQWITTCLDQLNHQTVTGQILTINKGCLKGLGFFKLPNEHQLPIKFNFPLTQNHLEFLDINGIKSCSVKGKLRMDMEKVDRYIHSHPVGSFRNLRSQNKPAASIPVFMEPTALIHRNRYIVPTPSIQQIIQHLKSLKDNTVTANIIFFQINSRGGIASYDANGFEIRFLFRLPQELQRISQDQLYQQFDRLNAKIHFSMNDTQLTDYVCSLGAEAFTHAKGSRYKLQIFAREEKLIERNDRQV